MVAAVLHPYRRRARRPPQKALTMKKKPVILAALVALAVLFTAGALFFRTSPAQEATAVAAKNRESLMRMHSQSIGRAEAPVQLVEFFDPACGTCAQFYPIVKNIVADHREDIRLTVRYAPFHPGSDEVVKVLEASRKQGKFWQATEALLASQPVWVQNHRAQFDLIWPSLERAGLDTARLKVDMQAPEVAAAVAQDMADATTLNVAQTPEFFVNGRPLPSFGVEQLRQLVNEELAAARARNAS